MSYSNIMESVKSLEKAYEFHKNEEKLLNEINNELKEYWNLSDMSHQAVKEEKDGGSSLVSTKMSHKQESKGKDKEKSPEAPKSTPSLEENV